VRFQPRRLTRKLFTGFLQFLFGGLVGGDGFPRHLEQGAVVGAESTVDLPFLAFGAETHPTEEGRQGQRRRQNGRAGRPALAPHGRGHGQRSGGQQGGDTPPGERDFGRAPRRQGLFYLHLVGFRPGAKAPRDYGPVGIANPDYTTFTDSRGKPKPSHHTIRKAKDGTLTPWQPMGVCATADGTVWVTTIAPHTLLKFPAAKLR
jgi:hypothetical protein